MDHTKKKKKIKFKLAKQLIINPNQIKLTCNKLLPCSIACTVEGRCKFWCQLKQSAKRKNKPSNTNTDKSRNKNKPFTV